MTWLSALLREPFREREEIIRQINNAEIDREYDGFFLSIKFRVDKGIHAVKHCARVPVEMRVYRKGACPVQFLLHIVQGYVEEAEIFCADSSEIDIGLNLEDVEKIEVIVEQQ